MSEQERTITFTLAQVVEMNEYMLTNFTAKVGRPITNFLEYSILMEQKAFDEAAELVSSRKLKSVPSTESDNSYSSRKAK
jgi:hypothetical protein